MKRRTFIATVLAALLTGGCALVTNFHYGAMDDYQKDPPLPQYEGALNVPGLQGEVDIYRDEYGVPHIFSENEHDLFFAVGYVQAQDRLFQMMLLRAIAEGRTAELLGDLGVPGMEMAGLPLSTTGIDKHQRVFGMKYMGEIGAELLKEQRPRVYRHCQAFSDGVNAYIESHPDLEDLPVEFQILKIKPEPWEVSNIVSFGRFIGTLLCSNLAIELPRHAAIQKHGADKGWEMFPIHGAPGPSIVPVEYLKNALANPRDIPPGGRPSDAEVGFDPTLSAEAAHRLLAAELAFRETLLIDGTWGSNNWIATGDMTESGSPILANDPHLQHIQPSLFYIMHVKGAGYDCYGVTFPGNPFIALGHGKKFAWGSTTSRADVQDLFVETVDPDRPGMYLYKGEWRPFTVRKETIKVRKGSRMVEQEFEVRQTIHGPIVNDFAHGLPEDTPPLALRWTGWDLSRDTRAFEMAVTSASADEFLDRYRDLDEKFEVLNVTSALERLMRAEKLDDFIEAMEFVGVPNQNWVAADSEGRIAYLPGGLVPIRKKGIGVLPAPGASGEFDWEGFIPLMEIPHMIDPERGWVESANQQVVDPRYYPYVFSTHYAEPWRGMRIEELIEELAPLDVGDMVAIQNDVYVKRAEWEVPIILREVRANDPSDPLVLEALAELEAWDYEADLDNTAAVIFFEFLNAFFDNTLADEMDKTDLKAMKIEGYSHLTIDLWVARGGSPYFDDVRTPAAEDMGDMMEKSLYDAMKKIGKKWGKSGADRRWGDIHVIKWFHPLGMFKGKALSVGPYPHIGADHTVRNAKVAGFGRVPYKSFTGPTMRTVVDLADTASAQIMIDGSESGMWLSPHYDDMHPLFVDSEYIAADKDPELVKRNARYHLVLKP